MSQNWKNVNNWHWVNKNCQVWAKEYFERELVDIEVEKDGLRVKTESVTDVTGDVDLNQRKGKIITIFDVEITLKWTATTPDDEEYNGKIHIPEVAHDTDVDDYVFDITVFDDNNSKQPVRDLIRKELTPILRKKLANFQKDLIDSHAKDVYIDPSELGQAAPEVYSVTPKGSSTKLNTSAGAGEVKPQKVVNMTSLEESIEFQTSAHELFETLIDVNRVQIWTRGPATIGREPGSKFGLFGGSVTGEIVEVVPDSKIVQKWRLDTWPEGHFSTVTFTFNQLSDSTTLTMVQKSVPIGQEDQTLNNWRGYYWNSIKQTFGYVEIGSYRRVNRLSPSRKGTGRKATVVRASRVAACSDIICYLSGFILLIALFLGVYLYFYDT